MLVLSRKPGESIFIGEGKEIEIKLIHVQAGRVRIGINAPKTVRVRREEQINEQDAEELHERV